MSGRPEASYLGLSYLERGDESSAAEHLRTFRDLTRSARVAELVDDARLMRTEHSLPRESRHFIAVSLESAMKSEQALQDARWRYAPGPSYGFYDAYAWGWRW